MIVRLLKITEGILFKNNIFTRLNNLKIILLLFSMRAFPLLVAIDFQWSSNESKSAQLFRSLLDSRANPSSAVIWTVSCFLKS